MSLYWFWIHQGYNKNIAPSWDGLLREISINNNINIDFLKDSHLSLEEKAHLVSGDFKRSW